MLVNSTVITKNMLNAEKVVASKQQLEEEEEMRQIMKNKKPLQKRGRKKKETQSQGQTESECSPSKTEVFKKEEKVKENEEFELNKENQSITYSKNGRKIIHTFAETVLEENSQYAMAKPPLKNKGKKNGKKIGMKKLNENIGGRKMVKSEMVVSNALDNTTKFAFEENKNTN
jgi:hypothetical protein